MTTDNHPQIPPALETIPRPVTAFDRLQSLYRGVGPFTSVYLATMPSPDSGRDDELQQRWQRIRTELAGQGAPEAALNAVDARLSLPAPDDTAAAAVLVDGAGATVVDHGLEPPARDFGLVDSLPYVAPLLEWHQRRMAHLVVTVDEDGADIATFGMDHYTRLDSYAVATDDLVDPIVATVEAVDARLVLIVGQPADTVALESILANRLPVDCRIVTEVMPSDADALADMTVRHVNDAAARATVDQLRERRFMATHDAAVEGLSETVAALVAGTADRLLVHDDPDDDRRLWIGPGPADLSFEERDGWPHARLVDALIRSAVMQNIPVHIIPTTGANGPDDDTAAITGGGG